ncbi:hypothetical protein ACFX2I_041235 [Malus domestica]
MRLSLSYRAMKSQILRVLIPYILYRRCYDLDSTYHNLHLQFFKLDHKFHNLHLRFFKLDSTICIPDPSSLISQPASDPSSLTSKSPSPMIAIRVGS